MVVAAFPLAKIGLLLMKQLSKPLANMIKNEAKKHPLVRKFVVLPTGKAYHWIEEQAQTRVRGVKQTEPMTEDEVVELGANAIGEIVLFGLLTIILLAEYNRQGDKKATIQRTKEEAMVNLQDAVLEMLDDVGKLKNAVERIQSDLDAIEYEMQSHPIIYDNNFWDVLGSRGSLSTGRAVDINSSSVQHKRIFTL